MMPDPSPDAYQQHRDGLIRRHILCSGRYIEVMWLREYDAELDPPRLLNHKRRLTPFREDTRTYVPWIHADGAVAGGGDNPLLRGAIAMAAFAIESMVGPDRTGLQHAKKLLDYIEMCEATSPDGTRTGFYYRCRYVGYTEELELAASNDEIVGLVLGFVYLHRATKGRDVALHARVVGALRRLAENLKENAYLLLPPDEVTSRPAEIHRGAGGLHFFQWALQEAFAKTLGDRFVPTDDERRRAALRMFTIWTDEIARGINRGGTYAGDGEILGILQLWGLQDGDFFPSDFLDAVGVGTILELVLAGGLLSFVLGNLAGILGVTVATLEPVLLAALPVLAPVTSLVLFIPATLLATLTALGVPVLIPALVCLVFMLKDPLTRFLVVSKFGELLIQEGITGSWYNWALYRHCLLFSLDEPSSSDGLVVAMAANDVCRAALRSDTDFYFGVVAQGLIARFVSIDYGADAQRAIAARRNMWDELPAGELGWVRTRTAPYENAPVRFHNHDEKIGGDFCWETAPGPGRVLGLDNDGNTRRDRTGVTDSDLENLFALGKDAMMEAGGLDYFFPRVLMSLWLGAPLHFEDPGPRYLRAACCLPFARGNAFQVVHCRAKASDDWLLLSSSTT